LASTQLAHFRDLVGVFDNGFPISYTDNVATLRQQGFTLIEIMVVVLIIGVLVGLSVGAYSGAKKVAWDTRRKGDLESIKSALEIYRTDCGSYPSDVTFGQNLVGSGICNGNTYMSPVPTDPKPAIFSYRYSLSGATYALCAYLETGSSSVLGCGGNCGTQVCNYRVQVP